MEHEQFPVTGFEFMDETATEEQKDIIHRLATAAGHKMDRNGKWPKPFSKWDAADMINALHGIKTPAKPLEDRYKLLADDGWTVPPDMGGQRD